MSFDIFARLVSNTKVLMNFFIYFFVLIVKEHGLLFRE